MLPHKSVWHSALIMFVLVFFNLFHNLRKRSYYSWCIVTVWYNTPSSDTLQSSIKPYPLFALYIAREWACSIAKSTWCAYSGLLLMTLTFFKCNGISFSLHDVCDSIPTQFKLGTVSNTARNHQWTLLMVKYFGTLVKQAYHPLLLVS
jgi:hypothetical protein